MPTNLYGPGDNYDLNNSHVLPALIRKMHEAKLNNAKEVVVWGTGTPKREFLYSEDMADTCVFLLAQGEDKLASLFNEGSPPLVNIGCGEDLTIMALAELVAGVVGFQGAITFDLGKPDGTLRKLLDITRMHAMGWRASTGLKEGLARAYVDFNTQCRRLTASSNMGTSKEALNKSSFPRRRENEMKASFEERPSNCLI